MLGPTDGVFQVQRERRRYPLSVEYGRVLIPVDHALPQRTVLGLPLAAALGPKKILGHERIDVRGQKAQRGGPGGAALDRGMSNVVLAADPARVQILQEQMEVSQWRADIAIAGVILIRP